MPRSLSLTCNLSCAVPHLVRVCDGSLFVLTVSVFNMAAVFLLAKKKDVSENISAESGDARSWSRIGWHCQVLQLDLRVVSVKVMDTILIYCKCYSTQ